jgi:hypothetical protein
MYFCSLIFDIALIANPSGPLTEVASDAAKDLSPNTLKRATNERCERTQTRSFHPGQTRSAPNQPEAIRCPPHAIRSLLATHGASQPAGTRHLRAQTRRGPARKFAHFLIFFTPLPTSTYRFQSLFPAPRFSRKARKFLLYMEAHKKAYRNPYAPAENFCNYRDP